MGKIQRKGGWMAFEVQAWPDRIEIIAKTHDSGIGSHINLTLADLASLGYVGWRPASERPGVSGIYPVVNSSEDIVGAYWDGTRWDRRVAYWLPLPPLPGKEAPK